MNIENRKSLINKLSLITDKTIKEISESAFIVSSRQLQNAVSKSGYSDFENFYWDSKYRVLSKENWLNAINLLNIDRAKYEHEFFDCDDFAQVTKGLLSFVFELNGCGQVVNYEARHSYLNVAFAEDDNASNLKIGIIEPQQDKYVLKSDKLYIDKANQGIVLW